MSHNYSPILWDHQMEAVAKALPRLDTVGGFYLAHDVGTGKTLTAIMLARLANVDDLVVITSKNGLAVWERQLHMWWPEASVALYHGGWASGEIRLGGPMVTVTTYEQLIEVVWQKPDGTVIRTQGAAHLKLLVKLLKRGRSMLVLDESHKAKSPSSKISRAAWKLEQATRLRLRMSGTPQHTMLDLWAQYRYLLPQEPMFQMPYRDYKDNLVVLGGPSGNWVTSWKESGKAAVAATIEPYTHAVDATVLQLPEPVYNVVSFELHAEERRAYDEMASSLAVEFERDVYAEASIVLAKAIRLQQITSGFVPTNEEKARYLGDSKLNVVMDLIEARPRRKIIVGYRFHHERERFIHRLEKMNRPYMRIDGQIGATSRGQTEEWFQKDTGLFPVLLIQEQSATAMTLTEASTIIPFSITPRVIDWTQFMGRAYRGGQTKFLEILLPCADDTVDEALFDGVRSKADDANMARILRESVLNRGKIYAS